MILWLYILMRKTVTIKKPNFGMRVIGDGHPCFIIGEIGINHNGIVQNALQLIHNANEIGLNAVKFQKRNPDICVPEHKKNMIRETMWGDMKYIDYKHRIEFGFNEYSLINDLCEMYNMIWFASVWDLDSLEFIDMFDPPCYKIASASLTDDYLISTIREAKKPIIMSTGMSTMKQIEDAIDVLGGTNDLVLLHCNSSYPAKNDELNLNVIKTFREIFDCPIGYSGHESGLQTTVASVVLGANIVERHITLDRSIWGTDQSASVEPQGMRKLVRDIRVIESALGDGIKCVYDSEKKVMDKLRRV